MASYSNSGSLLETTLRMHDLQNYLSSFKKFGIDIQVLGLLTVEDLRIIGIENLNIRNQLIERCKNLPKQKGKSKMIINEEFLISSLKDIDQHLKLLHAYLSVCVLCKYKHLSDIKTKKVMETFFCCMNSIQMEFKSFQTEVVPVQKTCKIKWKYVTGLFCTLTILYLIKSKCVN